MNPTLKWLERGLMTIGVVLACWCAVVLVEAKFFQQLPVPREVAAPAATPLHGDAGSAGSPTPPVAAPEPAAGTWLARLDAPAVDLSATVLEGSDDATLARGAGHIEDTALPGQEGNIGIAGHRDTTFRPVRRLKVGDVLTLTTASRVQRFRITWTKIVGPDDVYVLDPTRKPALTLVTCYPFEYIGHAPRRFIVRAEMVKEGARKTE